MSKTRVSFLSLAIAASLFAIASQVALPGPLAQHVKTMSEIGSVAGRVSVQPLPGTPKTVTFKFSKPNLFRVEDEDGFTVCDGASVYTYAKAGNSYTVAALDKALLGSIPALADVWVWMPFLDKDACSHLNSAKTGAKRTVKGVKVTEVLMSWSKPAEGVATVYFEDSGAPKGFNLKVADKESLVIVEEVSVSPDTVAASDFAFVAPAGSKKVEAIAAPTAGFAAVKAILSKNCMPCHNSQNRKSGIDLSTYDSILDSSGAVVPGDPEHSGIYRTTAGPRATMPKGGPKLKDSDTKIIHDWIKDGAKSG